jgi:hypothetical protein
MGIDETTALWSAIVGFVLPLAIATINQSSWQPRTRGGVAFAICLVAATGTVYVGGELDQIDDLTVAFLIVFGTAISTYHQFWKPTTIAPTIERVTDLAGKGTQGLTETEHRV